MAQQLIKPGGKLEIPTLDEIRKVVEEARAVRGTRIRASATAQFDANGFINTPNQLLDVYKVPVGAEFEVRRVIFQPSLARDTSDGATLLQVNPNGAVEQSRAVTNPGAGNEWSFSGVVAKAQARLVGGSWHFAASAAVANRFMGYAILKSGAAVPMQEYQNTVAVTAGQAVNVILTSASAPDMAANPTLGGFPVLYLPITPVTLYIGDSVASLTAGLQAGDVYSNISLLVDNLGLDPADIAYFRSGLFMEWAAPQSASGFYQVPGTQTWGAEQGPYLRNGEVFQIFTGGIIGAFAGASFAAGAGLTVEVEGVLRGPDIRRPV